MFSPEFIKIAQGLGMFVLIIVGFVVPLYFPYWMSNRDKKKEAQRRAAMTPKERTAHDVKEATRAAIVGLAFVGFVTELAKEPLPKKQTPRPGKKPGQRKISCPATSAGTSKRRIGSSTPISSDEEPGSISGPMRDTLLIGRNGTVAHRITDSLAGDDRLVVGNDGRVSHHIVDSFSGNDKLVIGNDGRTEHTIVDSFSEGEKFVLGSDGIEYRIIDSLCGNDKLAIANDGSIAYRITD